VVESFNVVVKKTTKNAQNIKSKDEKTKLSPKYIVSFLNMKLYKQQFEERIRYWHHLHNMTGALVFMVF